MFSIKQDIKLLDENIIAKGVESLREVLKRNNFKAEKVDYFLPHISSFFFKDKLMEGLREGGVNIADDKLFINLDKVGNVGAGSIYLMLEDRKSTRLNSSHVRISYAVFCLKKKKYNYE